MKKSTLRQQAEEKLSKRKKSPETETDTTRLLHELQVHQIELEMQNEELAQSRAETEATLSMYAELYAFAPVGYFTLTHDGTIRRVNLSGAKLLGAELSNLIMRRFAVFVAAQSLITFNDFLEQVFASANKQTCEVLLQKDGASPFWAHVEAVCESLSGQVKICYAIVSDITARKQAEEKLKHQSVWVQFVSDAVIITDLNLHIIDWNAAAAHIYGWNASEAVGRAVDELLKTEFTSMTQAEAQIILKQTGLWQGQIRQQTKSGQRLEMDTAVNFLKDAVGNMIGGIIVNRDITERKQAEDAIRFQATLLNAVEQAVIATDTNGIITYFNRAAESMYGWTANEALGRNILDVTVPEVSKEQAAELLSQLTQGKSWEGEFLVQRRDGSIFPALVHDSPVLDKAGKLIGIIGVSSDISDRKAHEQ